MLRCCSKAKMTPRLFGLQGGVFSMEGMAGKLLNFGQWSGSLPEIRLEAIKGFRPKYKASLVGACSTLQLKESKVLAPVVFCFFLPDHKLKENWNPSQLQSTILGVTCKSAAAVDLPVFCFNYINNWVLAVKNKPSTFVTWSRWEAKPHLSIVVVCVYCLVLFFVRTSYNYS